MSSWELGSVQAGNLYCAAGISDARGFRIDTSTALSRFRGIGWRLSPHADPRVGPGRAADGRPHSPVLTATHPDSGH